MTDACTPRVALALDSAGLACSVAVSLGEEVVAEEHIDTMHGQAEALLLLVDKAMRVAGQVPAALDLVVATVGPGSFTGIRAGLAAAHGIALATGARLLGVTSFDAVAVRAATSDSPETRFLLVALESRREDLYIQFFDPQGVLRCPLCRDGRATRHCGCQRSSGLLAQWRPFHGQQTHRRQASDGP